MTAANEARVLGRPCPAPRATTLADPGGLTAEVMLDTLKVAGLLSDAALRRSVQKHWTRRLANIATVGDVEAARALLRDWGADLWIVDGTLANEGALRLVREIRALAGSIPVILVTGSFDAASAVRFQQHAVVLLPVPFTANQLDEAALVGMRAALSRGGARKATLKQLRADSGALTYHELALRSDFEVGRVTKLVVMSRRSLERHFQTRFAVGPQQWLTEYRLVLALQRARPDQSVKELAANCLFRHPSNFCRTFKQRFGVAPGYAQRGAPLSQEVQRVVELRSHQALLYFSVAPNCRSRIIRDAK